MAWLDEQPGHTSFDLVVLWRLSLDVGRDEHGRDHSRYLPWGGVPRAGGGQRPTIAGRGAAATMEGSCSTAMRAAGATPRPPLSWRNFEPLDER